MTEDNQSSDSRLPGPPPEIHTPNESIPGEISGRRRGKFRRALGKVENVTKKIFRRSKDSGRHDPVLSNTNHEGADLQSALRAAEESAKSMSPLWGPVRSGASTVQNAQSDLDAAYNFQDTYLKPLRIFDTVIGALADIHPYAKMALSVLSWAAKIVLAQADRDEAILSLLQKLGEVYSFITDDERLHQISSMHAILGQISQQTLECAHFIRDYAETKNFWMRTGKNAGRETDDAIRGYSGMLDKLMDNFQKQVIRDVAIYVHRTGKILELSGMTYARGAGLDTGKQCLPETRTKIISEITDWVHSTGDNVPRVLWLSGPAGTGKSAITHTIAKWFKDAGGLGSCYCFDRLREADRRHEKIFSTIARDLADRDPELRRALADAVEDASSLEKTTDIIQQWDEFIMKPLRKLQGSTIRPIAIVIDALDESGGVHTRRHLLRILAGKLGERITKLPANFRIIVTSRPLPDIETELAGAQHIRRMSMDDIPLATAESDIYAYVSKELEEHSSFGDGDFVALAKKADGLFEWARLACEYIIAPGMGVTQRDSFNAVVSRDPARREHLLYDMYDFILTEIMPKDKHADPESQQTRLAMFRSVMGQILGTAEPLSLNSLNAMRSRFPNVNERYEVQIIVRHMGPLLSGTTNPTTPIRPLHSSFSEFLTGRSCNQDFLVDVSKVQRDLAFASLHVMEHELDFNICDLKSSYIPNYEDRGLSDRVETSISPHLSYSCQFWASHVQAADFNTELAEEIRSFLNHERLLFWLEVLGLKSAIGCAVTALPVISKWLKDHSGYEDVSSTAMDVQTFVQVFRSIISHSTPHLYVSALPFSPVNSEISTKFAAKFPNTLRLTSGHAPDWTAIQTILREHTAGVESASISPDGTHIAAGLDRTVRLWDTATGEQSGGPWRGHRGRILSVSFSPDRTRIVTGSADTTLRLWDAATGNPLGDPMRGHTSSVSSVSFSPDGARIVSGSDDGAIRLWDAGTGKPLGRPLLRQDGSVLSVSFSPDQTRIVAGSGYVVRLWDAATGQPVGEPLEGHTDAVSSVSFSPDGTRIVSGSQDNTIRLWDTATGQPVGQPLEGHTDAVSSVSFSPDGTRIVSGSDDHTIRLWDAATGQPVGGPLRGHTDPVSSVSFSPDGTRIMSGSWDQTIRLWDTATGQPVGQPLEGHTDAASSVSFSPDGTRIVSGSWDKTIRLWDTATGQPVGQPLEGHTASISSVSFSPDGTRIVSGSRDRTIRLWDTATEKLVGELLEVVHNAFISSVSFSPDGTRIVSGWQDKTIQLWDVATEKPLSEPWLGHTDAVLSVSFSPDGTRIVSGSDDHTIRLWDAATGQPVGEPLRGHTDPVSSVSFSPDGTRLVSASKDGTVRLWDVATRQPLGEPLRGHTESVSSVSFSLDGARIVSASKDGTVRLWDATITQNNQIIRFSSNSTHSLHNPAELIESSRYRDPRSTSFSLGVDGWMLGPNRQLLFWVPLGLRQPFYTPRTVLVIPRGNTELDLSRMAHGEHWRNCRDAPTQG